MSDFIIENGILKKYTGFGGEVVIPDGVTAIGDYAFLRCSSLTVVHIPDGVTSIGVHAFGGCKNLTEVTLPGSMALLGDSAFAGCKSLTQITLPDGVSIGNHTFSNCQNLKLALPDTVTDIGGSAFYACRSMADSQGFVIVRNVLYSYHGLSDTVVIPDSVTSISDHAFYECMQLKRITIPGSVASIDRGAFSSCRYLTDVIMSDGVTSIGEGAFEWCVRLTSVTIPDSVTHIGARAFSDCKKLTGITLSGRIDSIGNGAFAGCAQLSDFCASAKDSIHGGTFGSALPDGLTGQVDTLYPVMNDGAVKKYLLNPQIWPRLSPELQCRIFMEQQSKSMGPAYQKCVTDPEALSGQILSRLTAKASVKDCGAAAAFIVLFAEKVSAERLTKLYHALKPLKNAVKALKTIESDPILSDIFGTAQEIDTKLSPSEQKLAEILRQRKLSVRELEPRLKTLYGIAPADLPAVKTITQTDAPPSVLLFLLIAHETLKTRSSGQADVVPAYEQPGICPDAAALATGLDADSLQNALRTLADRNLGTSGRSKKMFLAYPICRYADEALMTELTKRAPSWRSSVSGNDAPPLATFRKANAYSNTRAAMLFADKYQELERYASIRHADADTIRDQLLSDVGLDAHGGKAYDLGNQTVVARLQTDLSFLIELPTGKTAKSLPKKNADPDKYAAANVDFSEMKKNVKKIAKNRIAILFGDFLSGRGRSAASWQTAYLNNVLLRSVASLLVWSQGGHTFIITERGPVTVTGDAYTISDAPHIVVAHPMEMTPEEVTAWQKYFTASGLKQPFEQIWEPVIDSAIVTKDRYKDCRIPYYRFTGQEKRGITVKSLNIYEGIDFVLRGCITSIERLDFQSFPVSPNDCFEVQSFAFAEYTRQVHHLVAYLDRVTIYDRIRKDDADIARYLPRFTLAQITEFIRIAAESGSINTMAVLLEYKNNTFADFDPMEEFSLDL